MLFPVKDKIKRIVFTAAVCILLLDKGKNLLQDIMRYAETEAYVWQQDYRTGRTKVYETGGLLFYVPLDSGQIGYEAFPGVPYERYDFEMRGKEITQGFRRK